MFKKAVELFFIAFFRVWSLACTLRRITAEKICPSSRMTTRQNDYLVATGAIV
jgi:hypothetical protein